MLKLRRPKSIGPGRIGKQRKTGTKYAELCYRIRDGSLTRPDIVNLLKSEGFTPGSASSTATYLINLSKPENAKVLEDVRAGKETVANARKLLAKRQTNPARSDKEKVLEAIEKAATQALQFKYSRRMFLDDCDAAFDAATRGQ